MGQSKNHFTISDIARDLDVKKSHIRFCEENGLIPPRMSKLKRRLYNRYDRERLKFIFHFVLMGYSKEEIVDLIGVCEANLNENDQLKQGIEYGLRQLKKLEKRKEELSFTKQTRMINEIEMLREYVKKIKNIESGIPEEPSQRPGMPFQEQARIPDRPDTAITARLQKQPTQHPVKVMSLFFAGLILVVLIGSYFYYQTHPNITKTMNTVQKKPIHSGKILIPQKSGPADQTVKDQAGVRTSKPSSIQPSETAPDTDGSVLMPEREKIDSTKFEDVARDNGQKEVASVDLPERKGPPVESKNALSASVSEPEKKIANEIEVKEVQEPESTLKTAPTGHEVSSVPEKQMVDSTDVETSSKDDLKNHQQKNELNRLKSFLDEYCQAYTNKDLDKFITFFASDATENNRPFHELLPSHRKNMEIMESLTYRIELMSYSKQTVSENLVLRGRFFIRYRSQKDVWKEQSGNIFMELLENGDSFLIKQLNYTE